MGRIQRKVPSWCSRTMEIPAAAIKQRFRAVVAMAIAIGIYVANQIVDGLLWDMAMWTYSTIVQPYAWAWIPLAFGLGLLLAGFRTKHTHHEDKTTPLGRRAFVEDSD